jgi:competence protein CoiA
MKYAMVDGQRREASHGLLSTCPECDAVMTPRCGNFRVSHWAHQRRSVHCWWQPETVWHRNWKECFPAAWQEVVHCTSNGERHISDVKTEHGLVMEFQHSDISEQERRSREEFYKLMHWVVDGQRLKWDRRRFIEALRCGTQVSVSPLTWVAPVEKCVLLQKWADSRTLVFFDFGETEDEGDVFRFRAPVLWALVPSDLKGNVVLRPVYRKTFIEAVTKGERINGIVLKVIRRTRRIFVPAVIPPLPHPWKPRPPSFKQHMARKRLARNRVRF